MTMLTNINSARLPWTEAAYVAAGQSLHQIGTTKPEPAVQPDTRLDSSVGHHWPEARRREAQVSRSSRGPPPADVA